VNDAAWWWSWLLTAVGLSGFVLARKKVWWCWFINIACQFLWLAYSLITEQWGFLVATVVYFVVFSMNAYTWTKEEFATRKRIDDMIVKDLEHHYRDRKDDDTWSGLVEVTPSFREPKTVYKDQKLDRSEIFGNHPEIDPEEWAASEAILGHIICWFGASPHHLTPSESRVADTIGSDGGTAKHYCEYGDRHRFMASKQTWDEWSKSLSGQMLSDQVQPSTDDTNEMCYWKQPHIRIFSDRGTNTCAWETIHLFTTLSRADELREMQFKRLQKRIKDGTATADETRSFILNRKTEDGHNYAVFIDVYDPNAIIRSMEKSGEYFEQAIVRTDGEIRVGRYLDPYFLVIEDGDMVYEIYIHEEYE
jgi:hypothetical protein